MSELTAAAMATAVAIMWVTFHDNMGARARRVLENPTGGRLRTRAVAERSSSFRRAREKGSKNPTLLPRGESSLRNSGEENLADEIS